MLVLRQEIVVIDEPTSQLDPASTESIFKLIEMLKKYGSTIILVEHKIDLLAEYADEIIVMKNNTIVDFGSTERILSNLSMKEKGIQLPQVTLLAEKLVSRGMKLDYLPITEEKAYEVIEKALGGDGLCQISD